MVFRRRSVLVLALAALGPAAAAAPCAAVTATLVADLNTDSSSQQYEDFRPRDLTVVGSRVVFAAYEPGTGTEIWASDGTPLGTELLRDTCQGPCEGQIDVLTAAGGVAYFLAGDPFESRALWRTDGTRTGTFPLGAALGPGGITMPYAAVGGTFFFALCAARCELWKSDGSAAGTVAVRDLGDFSFRPRELTAFGTALFFFGQTDDDRALWRSDGTPAGTVRVHTLPPGSSDPRLLTAAGTRLFFLAEDHGPELWTSDGTAVGTRPVTGFASPHAFERTRFLAPFGSTVVFVADDVIGGADLWTSDGSAAGTRRVTDFGFASPFPFDYRADQIERVGGRLLFVATDGLDGVRLWQSDGTPATTAPVPGSPALTERTPIVRVGGRVLFSAGNGAFGQDLWASDGTAAGTRKVRAGVCAGGSCSFEPLKLVPLPGQVYFATDSAVWRSNGTAAGTRRLLSFRRDGPGPEAVAFGGGGRVLFAANDGGRYRAQLWSSNGTAAGTTLVSAFANDRPTSFPRLEAALGGTLLFTACDGEDRSLWRTQGAGAAPLAGTALPCFAPGPRGFAVAGGLAYYLVDQDPARQLWRTDGTDAGTVLLASFPAEELPEPPLAFGDGVLFLVTGADGELSLWTSDGTPGGTARAFGLSGLSSASHLAVAGPELYFVGDDHTDPGDEVWRSDGTAAGTRRLVELPLRINSFDPDFTRVGEAVYFVARDPVSGIQVLWRTDGTPTGTAQVPLRPDGLGVAPSDLAELGGALLYFGATAPNGSRRGLFRTDGTAAGTVLLAPVSPRFDGEPGPSFSTVLGARLFFVAQDAVHGVELWSTDGTPAGTALVEDIAPGRRSSDPRLLITAGGRLFFAAGDDVHGVELWESDGTAAGTRLVQDLAPGGLAANPEQLTSAGNRLFFAADDGVFGQEVWSLSLAGGPACQPAATALCLNGGRFRAEAVWRDFAGRTGTGTALPLSADTGYFWFFDPANVEVVLKVLDGRGLNGHFWAFYGALSNVEYTLTVTDTQTGAARRYINPLGRLASVGDTVAFGPLGAAAAGLSLAPAPPPAPPLLARRTAPAADLKVACAPSSQRLCLNGGRFAVEVTWRDFTGRTGVGAAVPLTADTGTFWFFDAANVELVVKVLDGRPLNGKFWLFYGALSNVAYTLTVTDTQTGERKTYTNPLGRFASGADTGAF